MSSKFNYICIVCDLKMMTEFTVNTWGTIENAGSRKCMNKNQKMDVYGTMNTRETKNIKMCN